MADKTYRPGEVRKVEVRIVPNRGDVDVTTLVVTNPQFRILRFKQRGGMAEVFAWAAGSYDSAKGILTGDWDGTKTELQTPGHYAMELRATVDTEQPRHLVTVDVEI